MAQAGQQAAGAAVGAAIGAVAAGPMGAITGAQIGSSAVGAVQSAVAGSSQDMMDRAALKLNLEQARLNAAEKSSAVARNFRKSLASQVAIASMRGGAGSLALQFGNESIQNYLQDKSAIEAGLQIAETKSDFALADLKAKKNVRNIKTFSNFAESTFNAFNFSGLLKGGGGAAKGAAK